MGEVIDHPRRGQRLREVVFKLEDAISRLGILETFRAMPENEKEGLWQKAYVYEIEKPNAGIDLLKKAFSGALPYKNQSNCVYNT